MKSITIFKAIGGTAVVAASGAGVAFAVHTKFFQKIFQKPEKEETPKKEMSSLKGMMSDSLDDVEIDQSTTGPDLAFLGSGNFLSLLGRKDLLGQVGGLGALGELASLVSGATPGGLDGQTGLGDVDLTSLGSGIQVPEVTLPGSSGNTDDANKDVQKPDPASSSNLPNEKPDTSEQGPNGEDDAGGGRGEGSGGDGNPGPDNKGGGGGDNQGEGGLQSGTNSPKSGTDRGNADAPEGTDLNKDGGGSTGEGAPELENLLKTFPEISASSSAQEGEPKISEQLLKFLETMSQAIDEIDAGTPT